MELVELEPGPEPGLGLGLGPELEPGQPGAGFGSGRRESG